MALVHGAKEPLGVSSGLVLYLDAANARSYPRTGPTWFDRSGNGNNGTLTGVGYSGSNFGSFSFDGTDDYVPIGSTGFPFGSSAGTLSAWARTNTITGSFDNMGNVFIVSYGNPNTGNSRFLGINNSTYLFGGYNADITASGVPLNTWFNMAGVYTGSNALMYVNGVLVSGPTARSWNTVANSTQVGRQTNHGEYWSGNISQVSIYNRALTATEVAQNYNALKSRYI